MAEKIILEPIEPTEDEKKPFDLVLGIPNDEKFSIRLSSETKKGLVALAKKYNCSIAEVMRQLVEQGMKLVKNNRQK